MAMGAACGRSRRAALCRPPPLPRLAGGLVAGTSAPGFFSLLLRTASLPLYARRLFIRVPLHHVSSLLPTCVTTVPAHASRLLCTVIPCTSPAPTSHLLRIVSTLPRQHTSSLRLLLIHVLRHGGCLHSLLPKASKLTPHNSISCRSPSLSFLKSPFSPRLSLVYCIFRSLLLNFALFHLFIGSLIETVTCLSAQILLKAFATSKRHACPCQ